MKKICILFLFIGINVAAQNDREVEFIRKHALLAVQEMELYKVPASITLAQGILESASGTSELAVNAKNHFGIKCKGKEWNGETYYKSSKEDTGTRVYNETSCFRKYNSVEESFRDHSKFIAERPYYTNCFKSNVKGYADFAKCLKKSGYATDRHYARSLIQIIESYNLDAFDDVKQAQVYDQLVALYGSMDDDVMIAEVEEDYVVVETEKEEAEIVSIAAVEVEEKSEIEELEEGIFEDEKVIAAIENPVQEGVTIDDVAIEEPKIEKEKPIAKPKKPETVKPKEIAEIKPIEKEKPKKVIAKNTPKPKKRTLIIPRRAISPRARVQRHPISREYIVVKKGETLYQIAKTYRTTVEHLLSCNELEKPEDLRAYQYLFFAKKKSKGAKTLYKVQKGDDMYLISQKAGIKLKQLYKRNRVKEGYQPKVGETLYLRGKKPRK